MTTQNGVRSQSESSQVVVEERDVVVSKNGPKHVPVKKSTTVKPKTSVKEVSGKSDHCHDLEEGKEISEKRDNRSDRKEKIQPVYGSDGDEPSQIIPQVSGNSEPDEMPVSTETSDEKSKAVEKENKFWDALFKGKSEEDKTSRSHTASKQKEKGASVDISRKDETSQDYLWQIFVNPEQSSAKRFIIKKIDGTKKRPVKIQIEDLLRYRWFSCTESNYGWEWKFLPERKLKSIAYVRYMDEDPAIYGAYKCAANVITVRLEGRSCRYKPYYINKWIPLVLYPIKTGQDRRYWWGNFFIPIED